MVANPILGERTMTPYTRLIETFCQTQIPLSTNQRVRFEAIVAAILGTKQRRYGPLPAPETQVKIRDVVRNATGSIYKSDATMSGSNNKITFYLPWGARKQDDNQGIDILEFMALRQLLCLKKELECRALNPSFASGSRISVTAGSLKIAVSCKLSIMSPPLLNFRVLFWETAPIPPPKRCSQTGPGLANWQKPTSQRSIAI